MYQLFTLFALSLGYSGLVLGFSFFDEKLRCGELFHEEGLSSPRSLIILSIVMGILSVLKLIFAFPGDIPVIGDILPALAGILASIMLMAEYFLKKAMEDGRELDGFFARIEVLFLGRKTLIGVILVIIALVHFIIPSVVVI